MTEVTFTGERLHAGDDRFAIDIARHRAAYEVVKRQAAGGRILDFGCGSGHGAICLAEGGAHVFGIDRVFPDRSSRSGAVRYLLGDLNATPLRPASFDIVASFQVIEHLEDPTIYVDAIADLLRPDGLALVTTPNILTSDGVNPYHVHEYRADELASCLGRRFEAVEMFGIGASEPVRSILKERSRRIGRIMRLDPFRLRDRLPIGLVEWLFARFARLVRRPSQTPEGGHDVTWRDFPVGPAADDCLDLLAFCRRPR